MDSDQYIQQQLTSFEAQSYPTVEQTIINNASVLYKRKKFFLQDLRQLIKSVGFIIIGLVYLRDLSMLGFAIRAFAQYSLSNPYPVSDARLTLTEENKQVLSKFLLVEVLFSNSFIILIHLLFGAYKKSPSPDRYLHGGMTIQFIGERLPWSRLELIIYDILILFFQVVYHNLMCTTDDSKVLEIKPTAWNINDDEYSIDRSEIEGDGYSGNVSLIKLDLMKGIKEVLQSPAKLQFPQQRVISQQTDAPVNNSSLV